MISSDFAANLYDIEVTFVTVDINDFVYKWFAIGCYYICVYVCIYVMAWARAQCINHSL